MRYLLDTHTLIWFLEGDHRLSAAANDIVSDADNSKVSTLFADLSQNLYTAF